MEGTAKVKAQKIGSLVPAMTGFVTLLVSNGIGRFGYPPLIPALVAARWFTVTQADYLGAANLTGYILLRSCYVLFLLPIHYISLSGY
jgi:hypothetical protein